MSDRCRARRTGISPDLDGRPTGPSLRKPAGHRNGD